MEGMYRHGINTATDPCIFKYRCLFSCILNRLCVVDEGLGDFLCSFIRCILECTHHHHHDGGDLAAIIPLGKNTGDSGGNL